MAEAVVEGAEAPGFSLPATGDRTISLSDYSGKFLVLYFYPKDDTSGCTKEAIAFSGLKDAFEKAGAAILGVSPNNVASHEKFKKKHGFELDLAADEEKAMLESYGVWVEKSMYGRKYMGVERSTFLIGPDGKVVKAWRKVKVPGHAEAVLKAIEEA